MTKTSLLGSLAVGLLWIGPGAYIVAQQFTMPPPGTVIDRFTSNVVIDPRTVIQFTGNLGTIIPGTSMTFRQFNRTQAVVVTFVGDWPKPMQQEIPLGGFASGVRIRLQIDGTVFDPIGDNVCCVTLFESGGVATNFSVSNGSHGFTFVTDPVPPGDHVLEIVAFSDVLGQPGQPNGTVVLGASSTVVEHD